MQVITVFFNVNIKIQKISSIFADKFSHAISKYLFGHLVSIATVGVAQFTEKRKIYEIIN